MRKTKYLFGIPMPGPSPNPYFQTLDPSESEVLLASKSRKEESHVDNSSIGLSNKQYLVNMTYLDVYRDENICLIASYFTVGFALFFTPSPIYYYLVEVLNTSSTEIGVFVTVETIPWSLKVFYGLLSDSLPIMGYRRKPYILLGWMIFILGNFILASIGEPSIYEVIAWGFVCMNGLLMADVCNDTMSVERAKLESEESRGTLQTTCYIFRGLGMVIGSVLGATLYNRASWGWGLNISQIFLVNCIVPLITIGWTIQPLIELSPIDVNLDISVQLQNVWRTLQLRAVWKPMAFIYTYNVFQVPNAAWSNYLIEGLNFSDFEIGLLRVAAALMTYVGLIVYKQYFFNTGWQTIYIYTTALGVFFSFMQLLLIYQINQSLGIPNLAFSLGDTTFSTFIGALQLMPTSIMYVVLCPNGSEGTTYALLTTMSNLAGTVAKGIGSWMTKIWDVSNSTLEAGDYSGLAKLSILTSTLQFLPIALVFLLPNTKEEQKNLQEERISNRWAGIYLASTVVGSMIFTIVINMYLLSSE